MGTNRLEDVRVSLDREVETSIVVDPRLPDPAALVVFLGSQRWVSQIPQQVGELLPEDFLDVRWCLDVASAEAFSQHDAHVPGVW